MDQFLTHTTHFFILTSALLCFILCIQKKQYRHFLPFGFLAIAIYIIEKYASHLSNAGKYNIWLYNYETLIEFSSLSLILARIIRKLVLKYIISTLVFLLIALSLFRMKYVLKETELDNLTYAFGCLLTVFSSLYCLYEIFLFPIETSLQRQPLFWFCVAIILFNTTTFTFFFLFNKTYNFPMEIIMNLSIFNYIIYSLTYLIHCIAFSCQIKTKISFT